MGPRRRTVRVLVCLLGVVALTPAAAGAQTPTTAPRALASSFEQGLSGWRADGARLRLVHRGPQGRAALVTAQKRRPTTFSVYRSRPLTTGAPGTFYTAAAAVRGTGRGFRLCLGITESSRTLVVGSAKRCARSTGRWQRLGALVYQTKSAGGSLALSISKPLSLRGGQFRVDDVQLVASASRPSPDKHKRPPPPPPPPPSSASAAAAAAATSRRPRGGRSVPLQLGRLHQPRPHRRAEQAAGGRGDLGSHRHGLERHRGCVQGRAEPVAHRHGRLLRERGPRARHEGPDHAVADTRLGQRRPVRQGSSDQPAGLRRLRPLGGPVLAWTGRCLGGLERARPAELLQRHAGAVRPAPERRVSRLQGR